MSTLLKIFSAFCLFLIIQSAIAQKAPIKLGNVPKEDIEMTEYAPDPSADAVVLCDYGNLSFNYNVNEGGWISSMKRICRIKIFNDDGYHWATEKISLYDDNRLDESISQINGFTYNLENGKVVKSKLGKDDIMKEKTSEYYDRVSITLPNVKEGSVIEFSYTITSNYNTILDKWYFQRSIPVKWSEYVVSIPEYLIYLQNSQGYGTFYKYEKTNRARSITFTQTQRADARTGQGGSMSSSKVDYQDYVYHWIAKDLPGIKDEKFVGNYRNYLLSIEFQLSMTKNGTGQITEILSSWPKVVDKFLNDYTDFGPNMKKRNFYKDITEQIMAEYTEPAKRAGAVYDFVSQHMKWNDSERYMPSQNIKKSFEERTGSSADINALLVSMLRAVELDADPVIISTINHGLVHPIQPILSKYNYLIARVIIDNKTVLLDATEKNQPFGLLPYRCLNLQGYAISQERPGFVDLKAIRGSENTTVCLMTLNEDGVLKGTISNKRDGYSNISVRKSLRRDGEEKYIENFKSNHTDWNIAGIEIDASDEIAEPVKENIELEVSGAAEALGNIIYINPILSGRVEENPLKQDERKLPIEFIIPEKNTFMLTLTIPEGYVVDEMPKSINLVLPDRTAYLRFGVQQMGQNLQIMNMWEIKESFYTPDKFHDLKEFFAMLVSKHNEQIVLKKIDAN